MTAIDPALQAQVDAQLMEQGAFTALELLIDTGRLMYGDYESWRRREIEALDGVLMGATENIQAQIEAAVGYARSIGLVESIQEFHAWRTPAHDSGDRPPLRISSDARLQRLIASRYTPAQSAPQMDLFFDNPVVALSNGVVRALAARDAHEAQRQLDLLYAQAPNHADLAGFDRLAAALSRLNHVVDDPHRELESLLQTTPVARRLLGSQSRDLLTPLWTRLANALRGKAFSPANPALHRSFALCQAQDWPAVAECILEEPDWRLHAALCLRLAQSSFHRHRRTEALTAWCHLCWRDPDHAADVLDRRRQPDAGVTALWEKFLDGDEDAASSGELVAADFPAWLLLNEPGLAQQLPEDLPSGDTQGEQGYRRVHRWVQARRAPRSGDELSLRKALQAQHPALFRRLKANVER